MRRVITFLGIRPLLARYEYQGQVYKAEVFPEALRQFVSFDKMLVLVTEEAAKNSYHVLEELKDERIKSIPIPVGNSDEEMWQIFSVLTESVESGDSVIFDITHGLRSIPFLVFLAAAFLKSARRATIEAIYYGAYELGNVRATPPVPAPVIDLSPFVELLDWMQATAHFEATGNGLPLAELIKSTGDPALQKTGAALRATTQGLRLGLATQVGESVSDLTAHLEAVPEHAQPAAAPMQILVNRIAGKYKPLALNEPLDIESAPLHLRQQANLISWYVDNDLALQAWLLAREWLVTWIAMERGEGDLLHKDIRGLSEQLLNDITWGERSKATEEQRAKASTARMHLGGVRELERVKTLWERTIGIRNQLAHMSMRHRSSESDEIVRRLRLIKSSIDTMAERHLPQPPEEELREWNPWAEEE